MGFEVSDQQLQAWVKRITKALPTAKIGETMIVLDVEAVALGLAELEERIEALERALERGYATPKPETPQREESGG